MTREWFKDGFFWRHPESGNAGDLIFNTMYKIMQDGDYSDWAYSALTACADLLRSGKRWPDRLTRDDTAKNWLQWKWDMLRKNRRYSRPQQVLTRDPFIAVYAAAFKMNRWQLIEVVTVPWYLYRPTLWNWRKYIMSGDIKYLRRYRFWSRFSTSQKDYVVRLRAIKEDIINATLYKYQ